MNSVVMSIRGLLSLELWILTLLIVPVSSGGSGGSCDSKIVGFDWSYQFQIQKWYFVNPYHVSLPCTYIYTYIHTCSV